MVDVARVDDETGVLVTAVIDVLDDILVDVLLAGGLDAVPGRH